MDFFKSVFSDDPDPHSSQPDSESSKTNNSQQDDNPDPNPPPNPQPISAGGGWSFGGFIKTLSVKSESVIETYRRDLQEFGTGLKKELEVAQGSIGTVSSAIDEFGNSVLKGTAQIISHGKDAILAVDHESDSSDNNYSNSLNSSGLQKPYSRFDAQVRAIQGDVSTYCEEVDDLDEYKKWKSGFVLDNVNEEIESLFEENGAMESIYKRFVPHSVDHETFWSRYFYRVFKLKQAENLRASLVKRAISREEEEELSWDVDDDDDDGEGWSQGNLMTKKDAKEFEDVGRKNPGKTVGEEANVSVKSDLSDNKELVTEKTVNKEFKLSEKVTEKTVNEELELGDKVTENTVNKELGDKVTEKTVKEDSLKVDGEGERISKSNADEVSKGSVAKSCSEDVVNDKMGKENNGGVIKEDSRLKSDDKVAPMDKGETGESSKDSDLSIVSSQPSMPEEEDLGWDEIEDLSSIDEKKVTHARSPNRADLRKRLSVAEEEEDLSWDIEDDDEPVKA